MYAFQIKCCCSVFSKSTMIGQFHHFIYYFDIHNYISISDRSNYWNRRLLNILSSLFASTFAIEAISSTHSYLPFSKFQAFHPLTTTGLAPLVILSLLNFKVVHLNISYHQCHRAFKHFKPF